MARLKFFGPAQKFTRSCDSALKPCWVRFRALTPYAPSLVGPDRIHVLTAPLCAGADALAPPFGVCRHASLIVGALVFPFGSIVCSCHHARPRGVLPSLGIGALPVCGDRRPQITGQLLNLGFNQPRVVQRRHSGRPVRAQFQSKEPFWAPRVLVRLEPAVRCQVVSHHARPRGALPSLGIGVILCAQNQQDNHAANPVGHKREAPNRNNLPPLHHICLGALP